MAALMKTSMRIALMLTVLVGAMICAPDTAHAQSRNSALTVTGIRFGAHEDKTRLVIDLNAPAQYRAFTLQGPDRLVIDLPHFGWTVGTITRPASTHVTDVRQGPTQPGISRIVIDMNQAIAIRGTMMLPRSGQNNDRLVIDYSPTTNPSAEKNRVFGTLQMNDAVAGNNDLQTPAQNASVQTVSASAAQTVTPARKPSTPQNAIPKSERPLIVLDAGHGGDDPGALGPNGLKEKNITLAMARDLKKALEETGRYRVMMTRDKDVYLRLGHRVQIARHHNADLFISLHADSLDRKHVSGASIYTLSEKASDSESARLAERENQSDLIAGLDLSVEDEEVASILVNLAMRDTMNQSKFFANTIVDFMQNNSLSLLDNPHRYAGFAVLKAPDVPSVLIEAGFMSNNQEANKLNTPAHRARIAGAIVRGIDAYFEQMQRNGGN
ncbi:N-acetylmuramoyl-L-alanine amidase [Micavibrio aeruginosavorus]|uniref:N-acetylmuramoyl-L-alanine amidase n=1 Tax=Micavibrio aeruginosavorus TaxID=349221 RepID=UPI003F4AF591